MKEGRRPEYPEKTPLCLSILVRERRDSKMAMKTSKYLSLKADVLSFTEGFAKFKFSFLRK